ncbi:MAG TPA: hypothetical protein PLZ86_09155, partial [bacterium]|nr:hypothetical protein [bacterium]
GLMPKQQSQIVGHYNRMLRNPKFGKGLISGGKINAKGMNVLFKSIPKGVNSGAPVLYLKYQQSVDPKQQKKGKVKGVKGNKGKALQMKGK